MDGTYTDSFQKRAAGQTSRVYEKMERKRKGREREGRRRIVKSSHQFSLIIEE